MNRTLPLLVATVLLWLGGTAHASAADGQRVAHLYATPDSSLADVVRHARELRRTGRATTLTIHLSEGTYRLYEPLRLRPEDSGLTIDGHGGATISGGMSLGLWRREGHHLVTDVPHFNGRPIDFRQLWLEATPDDAATGEWVKGIRARSVADFEQMPRIVGYDKERQVVWIPRTAVEPFLMNAGQATADGHHPDPLRMEVPYLEMVLHEMWCTSNLRVKSLTPQGDSVAVSFHNPESKIQFEHPWPSPMTPASGHPSPFYLVNAMELLDEPGEWYHDIGTHRLYYQPRQASEDGRPGGEAAAVVPVLETLVELVGTADHPVRDVTFRGITFSHTTWMRPSEKGHVPLQAGMYLVEAYKLRPQADRPNNHKLDNQGWLGRAAAAVELRHAENACFDRCRFSHLGGTGLDYVVGCHGGTVSRCRFDDIAMNALVVGSFSPEGLETHRPYAPADNREVCSRQTIVNSEFHNVANEDWGCLAIAAGYVSGINIDHNTIHHVPYTAISVGWGWNRDSVCMGNNRIHANLIYDYARHTYDCAGVYTLGNQPGSIVSENVVRDIAHPSYVHDPDHWFYLYTDEGSSNITVRDNWTPSEKFLQNANGPGNTWLNNGPQVADSIKTAAGVQR